MRYLLLDANVLVPYYVIEDPLLQQRVSDLLADRSKGRAFLFLPNICVPEVLKAIAKKCFQEKLYGNSQTEARSAFERIRSFRTGRQPSAIDVMIVAMGLDLVNIHGRENFCLVTAERPLFDLCSEAKERLPPVFHLGERDSPRDFFD